MRGRKTARVIAVGIAFLLAAAAPSDGFFGIFDSWRQPDVKAYLRKAWGIREAASLSLDTIRAILDADYAPDVSYWQLVGLFIRADEMYELEQKGRHADAAYVGLKSGVSFAFASALRAAGLGGVGAIAQAGAAPIVWSLETFMKRVSKAKFEKHLAAYFLLRSPPYNFSHEDILNRRSPTTEVLYADDGWIWDVLCEGQVSDLCRRGHFRVGGRPLDQGTAADVYGLARDLWDAARQAAAYETEKAAIAEQVRTLFEDATCAAPGFEPGAACESGRPGICGPGTWHCTRGTVKCVPSLKPKRELCGDQLDNDCDGMVEEGCAPVPTPTPAPTVTPSPTPGCLVTEPEGESTCDDALDNDCDAATDCDDPHCATDPSCEPVAILTAVTLFAADSTGSAVLGQVWNTTLGDGIWPVAVTPGGQALAGPLLNDDEAGFGVALAGGAAFELLVNQNQAVPVFEMVGQHVGINLFFDGASVPSISALAQVGSSLLSSNSSPSTAGTSSYGGVPGSGTLTFQGATAALTLTQVQLHGIDSADRVSGVDLPGVSDGLEPNGVNDAHVTIVLQAAPPP